MAKIKKESMENEIRKYLKEQEMSHMDMLLISTLGVILFTDYLLSRYNDDPEMMINWVDENKSDDTKELLLSLGHYINRIIKAMD